MPQADHIDLVRAGASALQAWRAVNPQSALELSGADLRNANLGGCDLSFARLEGADLTGANLFGANLEEANLHGAQLRTAVLSCANFANASLQEANLKEVQFDDGDGSSADLTGADLRDAQLTIQGEGDVWNSFLELSTVKGLETITFSDSSFLPSYLEKVFAYAVDNDTPEARRYPHFFDSVVQKIKALRTLLPAAEKPPEDLIDTTRLLSHELVSYIKDNPGALFRLPPRRFEELVAELLASFGWQVELTAPSRDGGYDLFAVSKDISGVSTSWVIECKRYPRDRLVGIDAVRSLFGVKTEVRAANVLLATTSSFSESVKELKSSRYDIALCDYTALLEWIQKYKPKADGTAHSVHMPELNR